MMRSLVLCVLGVAWSAGAADTPDPSYSPAMQAARDALFESHGGGTHWLVLGERFEYLAGDEDELVWEAQGWRGGDLNKLWVKTEGAWLTDDSEFEEFELQLLYSRAIHPFWDFQVGLRHDFEPNPSRTYAVAGFQGTAPYWFELDGALFLSDEGDLSARFEAEYELRLTQRLMLQPRLELNAALSDDEPVGVGSGLSTAQAGLRLRYELRREVAPYLGVTWSRNFGNTADLSGTRERVSAVMGLRFWF